MDVIQVKIKKITVCLLGASFGTHNMGVNALTVGTLKAFFERYPEGKFIFARLREKWAYVPFPDR